MGGGGGGGGGSKMHARHNVGTILTTYSVQVGRFRYSPFKFIYFAKPLLDSIFRSTRNVYGKYTVFIPQV